MIMRSNSMLCGAVLVVTTLGGCASSLVWYHPTRNQEQRSQDRYDCQRDVAMLPYAPPPQSTYRPAPPSYTSNAYSRSSGVLRPVPT